MFGQSAGPEGHAPDAGLAGSPLPPQALRVLGAGALRRSWHVCALW